MVTQEEVRRQLTMFVAVLQTVVAWIPGEVGVGVKKVATLLVGLSTQDWFVGLVTYLLNTFGDKPVTQDQLSDALSHFAKSVKSSEELPVKFDLK
jgi:hypothetical protein